MVSIIPSMPFVRLKKVLGSIFNQHTLTQVHPRSPGYSLRESYTELAYKYAFVRTSLFGRQGIEDGFMYPINPTDEKMKKKLKQRISKVGPDVERMKGLLERIEQERRDD